MKALLRLLAEEEVQRAAPLFVFDAGYDPVSRCSEALRGVGARSSSVCGLLAASSPIRASLWSARSHRQAASSRAEDEVRGPKHLASTLYGVHMGGLRLRDGASARLLEVASEGLLT